MSNSIVLGLAERLILLLQSCQIPVIIVLGVWCFRLFLDGDRSETSKKSNKD